MSTRRKTDSPSILKIIAKRKTEPITWLVPKRPLYPPIESLNPIQPREEWMEPSLATYAALAILAFD